MRETNSSVFADFIVGVTGGFLENNIDFISIFQIISNSHSINALQKGISVHTRYSTGQRSFLQENTHVV